MSLLNLLSVGRSLVGIRDEPPRYQMADKGLLPNFGAKARYSCPVLEEREPAQLDEPARAPRQQELPVSPEAAKCNEKPISPVPVLAKENAPKLAPAPPVAADRAWKGFFGKMLGWRKVEKVSRPKPLVQAELSLEAVRVVRNDLSDADVELVSPVRQSTRYNKTGSPVPGKGTRWTDLTAKLFETGRSRQS